MTRGNVSRDGFEYMVCCVNCSVDKYGICSGVKITLDNDHKKQCWSITKTKGAKFVETLASGKDETLEMVEFQKWLSEHGYTEDETECEKARNKGRY